MKYVLKGAQVLGQVRLGDNVSIWYNAVLRGDEDKIEVGDFTNVQDNCVVHCEKGMPTVIGEYVTVGHGAILHSAKIGDNCLIGMGAIILNGAEIGKNCIIGAGSLVTENAKIPDNSLAFGSPAKVIRGLEPKETKDLKKHAEEYFKLAKKQ